jgi:hypothetical protein
VAEARCSSFDRRWPRRQAPAGEGQEATVGGRAAVGGQEAAATTGDVWSVKCEVLAGCERAGGRARACLWIGCTGPS